MAINSSSLDQDNQKSSESWDLYLKNNPEEGRIRLKLAKASRTLAVCGWHTPQWYHADREGYSAQRALLALWDRRKSAREAI